MFTGLLRTRILIQKETTSSNKSGTPTESFEDLKYTYARKIFKGGDTEYADEGELPYTKTEFTVRYDSRINYKCRIYYGSKYYIIHHIANQNNGQ